MTADAAQARGRVAYAILDVAAHDSVLQANVQGLRVFLHGQAADSGAEVQVAVVDGSLVVIAAGKVVMADTDAKGYARLRVSPE